MPEEQCLPLLLPETPRMDLMSALVLTRIRESQYASISAVQDIVW